MAMAAYQRASALLPGETVFGLGCTAAIATDRDRRGSDRCHIALQSPRATRTWDLTLDKSQTRAEQESACAELIIDAIAASLNIAPVKNTDADGSSKQVQLLTNEIEAPPAWQSLLAGTTKKTIDSQPTCIFPGAFNPFHEGHRGMLEVAETLVGERPLLEVSIANVDKPPLDFLSMSERGVEDYELVFTNAPTFLEKSALFPGVTFIVGADTISRIDETKYYADEAAKQAAFETMKQRDVSFLVFGRYQDEGFIALGDLSLSPTLAALCREVPEDKFRRDISSTDLRKRQTSP